MTHNRIRVSLDCDGVITDTYGFFEEAFKNKFGITPNESFYNAVKAGDFKSYENQNGIKEGELTKFFGSYEGVLFEELGNLKPMPGVVEGIKSLQKLNNLDKIAINSYRPSEYKGKTQDTKRITLDWMEKYEIPVSEDNIYLAQSKDEKTQKISTFLNKDLREIKFDFEADVKIHIDDDLKILKKLENFDSERKKEFKDNFMKGVWFYNNYSDDRQLEEIVYFSKLDDVRAIPPKDPNAKRTCLKIPSNLSIEEGKPTNIAKNWGEVPSLVKMNQYLSFWSGQLGKGY